MALQPRQCLTVFAYKRAKWSDGVPAWLKTSSWWKNIKQADFFVGCSSIRGELEKIGLSLNNDNLVRLVDSRWNQFDAELRLMHSRLERLGVTFINGKVVYIGDKEFGNA